MSTSVYLFTLPSHMYSDLTPSMMLVQAANLLSTNPAAIF
jgi:hypothetical protein